jgi:serralysin
MTQLCAPSGSRGRVISILSAAEQYLLELINQARLDPLAKAASLGIDLNQGLAPGTLTGTAKQVLAHNVILSQAAEGHSNWMLANEHLQPCGPWRQQRR